MEILRGIPVSPGVVIGRVFVLDEEHQRIPRRSIPPEAVPGELARLDRALKKSIEDLNAVCADAEDQLGADAAKIFTFHASMLSDPTLTGQIREKIERILVTTEHAVSETLHEWAERFDRMPDPAFKTKTNDILDLSARLLRHLIGEHASKLADLDHEAIVVAPDLTPSQTAAFDREKVVAFVTDMGGPTSHTAIIAHALGIPAVVGCQEATHVATDGTRVIIDGNSGLVILDPDEAHLAKYRAFIKQRQTIEVTLSEQASLPAQTLDGVTIELLGNIEFPDEVRSVLDNGGQGIGLYRTEYLYLAGNADPTEAEHFEAYAKCVELLDGHPLTLRTVDLGADKYASSRPMTPERNPALGFRSIRYCLKSLPMFKRQLRAMLRASALGPVKIMFPLIASVSELRQAKHIVRDVMEDLDEEGVAFDRDIELGMMVEIPSAALMAETFAKEAAFFSIGTNDLIQYALAVDRTNERIANLYNPGHPAIIRLIRETVRASRRNGIPCSLCGELASELEYLVLLIGLGLRTLSMTAPAIPEVKRLIRSVTVQQCERIARRAATLDSDVAVASYLRNRTRKIIPDAFDSRTVDDVV